MVRRAGAFAAICVIFLLGFTNGVQIPAQTGTGEVHGTVTDPSGALIASATVVLNNEQGVVKTTASGRDGAYRLTGIVAGTYQLEVSAPGFAPLSIESIVLVAGRALLQNVTLEIPVAQQQVEVTETTQQVSTEAEGNASSIVIKGKDLSALSDDPDELQTELTELAGPSAGPNGAQFYIDGFSNGQLPPKSSIREIRVNQNPFSAQFDKLGYGRVEILTKPGTDKLHGNVMVSGNDSVFNSLNPFVKSEPAYHSLFLNGGVGGSLNSKTSWYASVFRRDNSSNSIINAELLDSSNNVYNYSAAVATPQSNLEVSPRLDFQIGSKDTLTVRYQFQRRSQTNSGVSGFSLQSMGYDTSSSEHSIQISESHVVNSNVVNETRLQLERSNSNRAPYGSTPTINVSGAFNSGGNTGGRSSDLQNQVELQNYTTAAAGRHAIQFGARYRLTRDSNTSTGGFNGTFSYMDTKDANGNVISALTNYIHHAPAQYSVNAGRTTADLGAWDAGIFYQDDYKFNPNLTLSYGLRYETQNYINDQNDWAPRLSLAWAPWGAKGKTVIRAGYGWFYDRFRSNNILNALRQNGDANSLKQYIFNSPDFYEGSPACAQASQTGCIPAASQLAGMGTTAAPTIYQLAPNLKASVNMQAAIGVENQWGRSTKTSVTYINSRGVHQYMSENLNAYLPGTFDGTTGVRPNGINENIYQYRSSGIYKQNQLMVSYSVQANRVSIFGFYGLTFANSDTSGAGYFSSNPSNPMADWGPASFAVRNRLMFGGSFTAPFGISMFPMLEVASGSPFNITVGQDLNGDSQFNDRPAWATTAGASVMSTKYGNFDLNPGANAARVPYNMLTGPGTFGLNMRISKSIGIGPKVTGGRTSSGGDWGGGGPPGGGRGSMRGGGLGPGGLSGSGGPPRNASQSYSRKYALVFTAQGQNVLNHINLANPVSVLSSPLFGKSNAIASGMFGSAASNRSINLQLSFNF